MTSVKEVQVEDPPTDTDLGRGSFAFTDDYSVFDWGKMPDQIPDKGASLCTMGAFNFERLGEAGIPTHYRGVGANGATTELAAVSKPPTVMAIALTQVPDLPHGTDGYDYDAYHDAAGDNYLVPLEVVFRNTVPVGSSLRGRTEPRDLGLDYDAWPEEVVDLPEAVVEFSTKYEEQDRYLSRREADEIAGLADIEELESLARQVNDLVTAQADAADLVHQDGKIECFYFRGEIRVADVVGTFDENRFSYDDQQVSKEVIRQYYKRADPDWVDAVARAKEAARRRGVADWRALCDRDPDPLPANVLGVARNLYAAGANAYTGTEWFDAPSIDEAVAAVRDL